MHEGTKKAMSQRTGRIADLPPSIYNNPFRMESGKWILLNDDGSVPNQMPSFKPLPSKPRDTSTIPEHIKQALGMSDDVVGGGVSEDAPFKTGTLAGVSEETLAAMAEDPDEKKPRVVKQSKKSTK